MADTTNTHIIANAEYASMPTKEIDKRMTSRKDMLAAERAKTFQVTTADAEFYENDSHLYSATRHLIDLSWIYAGKQWTMVSFNEEEAVKVIAALEAKLAERKTKREAERNNIMGIDLTLMRVKAFDVGTPTEWGYAHTMIDLNSRRELFSAVESLPTHPAPRKLNTYRMPTLDGEPSYGYTPETPYGLPIRCVTAGNLATLQEHAQVLDDTDNQAAWAYLKELEPDTLIALYWH